jgi:N-acetylmuramoyl-L-alanine amidase
MDAIERPSPNHDARPARTPIDILLLHYTGMATAKAALDRLCEAAAKVSAHYLVDEDGTVYALVPEDRRAWHAGRSRWAGASDINGRSVGVEIVNPGHEFGYRPFPEAQMEAVADLAREIVARHAIPPARVLGHSDVAPRRKQDPGELFDWVRLAREGVGLWPEDVDDGPQDTPPVAEIQAMLGRFGYGVPNTGVLDEETRIVLAAFQRHFRPSRVDGEIDGDTVARLGWLIARLG